jgi:hypothetical protein
MLEMYAKMQICDWKAAQKNQIKLAKQDDRRFRPYFDYIKMPDWIVNCDTNTATK